MLKEGCLVFYNEVIFGSLSMFLMLSIGLWHLFCFGPWIPLDTTHSAS